MFVGFTERDDCKLNWIILNDEGWKPDQIIDALFMLEFKIFVYGRHYDGKDRFSTAFQV